MDEIIILGIAGSLRKDSYNRLALKASQEQVPDGAVLNLAELHGIPVFDQDTEMALPATSLSKQTIPPLSAVIESTKCTPTRRRTYGRLRR